MNKVNYSKETKAYKMGFFAVDLGQDKDRNPFENGSIEYYEWQAGFEDHQEKEQTVTQDQPRRQNKGGTVTFTPCPCPPRTPWGPVQHSSPHGPGLWSVSTASHGGIYMSPQRLAEYKKAFPTFDGYAGLPWLEEDCDACLAVLIFPADFTPEAVFYAVRMISTYACSIPGEDYFAEPRAWLLADTGAAVRAIAAAYELTRAGLWEAGGSSSDGKGTDVWVYRGKERATLFFPRESGYSLDTTGPRWQSWFTDAEVQQYRKPESPAPPADGEDPNPIDDSVKCCPDCERPNQFGEVCPSCQHDRQVEIQERGQHLRAPSDFNEADCGGAFDGNQVTSDADPGL